MSRIIKGNVRNTIVFDRKIKYKYPDKLDLRPWSETHRKLAKKIFGWAEDSRAAISDRFADWQTLNRSLTGFVDPDITKVAKDNLDKTLPIVIPMSYATLEVFLTYTMSALLKSPIFKYEGFGPEDVNGAALLEKVVELHTRRNKVALSLNTMFRDNFVYGVGTVTPVWKQRFGFRTEVREDTFFSSFRDAFVSKKSKPERVHTLLFEGNALENIDAFYHLPDPNVAAHDVQKAEYSGWIERTNYFDLLTEENESNRDMFNVKYLKDTDATSSLRVLQEAERDNFSYSENENIVDNIWIYGKIIPKDWELGDVEYPEKWLFGLAGDQVIIHAAPVDLDHDMIPMVSISSSGDGYSAKPPSILQIFEPMQTLVDWLFNSHIANVRKSINDMLLVDPSLVNMKDLKDPQPGMLVRLRAKAWGRNQMENAVKQLKVQDITQGHIADVNAIIGINQSFSGAVDMLLGVMRTGGERRSATEARDTKAAALSRLEKASRMIGLQGLQDLSYIFAKHAQQFMSQDLYIKTIGRWEEVLSSIQGVKDGRLKVSLKDISVDFDIVENDGSVPGNEPADLWLNLFQMLLKSEPDVRGQFDMVRIFKHLAVQLGAKNIEDFIRTTDRTQLDIKPNGEVEKEVKKGNLIDVKEVV